MIRSFGGLNDSSVSVLGEMAVLDERQGNGWGNIAGKRYIVCVEGRDQCVRASRDNVSFENII